MSTKKKVGVIIGIILALAVVIDAVRYLKPDAETSRQCRRQIVFQHHLQKKSFWYTMRGAAYTRALQILSTKKPSQLLIPVIFATRPLALLA